MSAAVGATCRNGHPSGVWWRVPASGIGYCAACKGSLNHPTPDGYRGGIGNRYPVIGDTLKTAGQLPTPTERLDAALRVWETAARM